MKYTFFIAIFLSCHFSFAELKSPYDLVAPPAISLTSPSKLSSEQVDQDIQLLVTVFNKAFSGRFYFTEDQLHGFTQKIESIKGEMTTVDFWTALDDALLEIPDNHTAATIFYNSFNQMTPHRMSQVRRPHVGVNKISSISKIWEVSKVGKNQDIALVAISSFPSSKDPIWKTFIDSVQSAISNTKATIVDLRSNSGGDDYFGMEMAKIFWGGPFHHLVKKQYNNTTPEALALFANHFRLQSIETGQAQNPNSISEQIAGSFIQQIGQALNGSIPPVQVRSKTGSSENAIVTEKGYRKPIYILIDSLTASSGEFTAMAFSLHPYAKIIGENSAGYVHFGNAGKILLPNSKIQVSISTQFSQLENKLFIEKTGITPNQPTPGQDAFDIAIKEIDGNEK